MEPNQTQNPNDKPTNDTASEQPAQDHPAEVKKNNKVLYGIAAGLGILFLILIGLLIALLTRGDGESTGSTSNQTGSSSQTENQEGSTDNDNRRIVKTVPIESGTVENIELVIYEPKQTGSNTTIDFALRNSCEDCEEREFVSASSLLRFSYNTASAIYALDNEAGQRYAPITDADGNAIASRECSGFVTGGQQINCFVSLTKIPSGTTVSLVLGSRAPRVDGIRIP